MSKEETLAALRLLIHWGCELLAVSLRDPADLIEPDTFCQLLWALSEVSAKIPPQLPRFRALEAGEKGVAAGILKELQARTRLWGAETIESLAAYMEATECVLTQWLDTNPQACRKALPALLALWEQFAHEIEREATGGEAVKEALFAFGQTREAAPELLKPEPGSLDERVILDGATGYQQPHRDPAGQPESGGRRLPDVSAVSSDYLDAALFVRDTVADLRCKISEGPKVPIMVSLWCERDPEGAKAERFAAILSHFYQAHVFGPLPDVDGVQPIWILWFEEGQEQNMREARRILPLPKELQVARYPRTWAERDQGKRI
jgi:hypothetical protein